MLGEDSIKQTPFSLTPGSFQERRSKKARASALYIPNGTASVKTFAPSTSLAQTCAVHSRCLSMTQFPQLSASRLPSVVWASVRAHGEPWICQALEVLWHFKYSSAAGAHHAGGTEDLKFRC